VPVQSFQWQSGGDARGLELRDTVSALVKEQTPAICFSAKDHGADAMEDCSPTLRAGGHANSHANAGVMPAIAFNITPSNSNRDYNARQTERSQAITGSAGNAPSARGGDVIIQSAVRRLTPRECERLQGFPDTQRTAIISVCEGEKSDHAKSAQQSSVAPRRGSSAPVAVSVLIDLEQERVVLRSLDGLSWSANTAEPASSSPLSMPADAFARLAAHTLISLVPVTGVGAGVSLPNGKSFSPLWSGSASVSVYGRAITALAADAERFTSEANRLSKSTMSPVGPDTPAYAQTLETWSCCVCAAISGFIPEQIRNAPSYTIEVEVRAGFTRIPWRGKGADQCPDGPRYKALGNSMAVPVMRWIGERIQQVEALSSMREAA
jgi:site-specific DNA-cytosine methylase